MEIIIENNQTLVAWTETFDVLLRRAVETALETEGFIQDSEVSIYIVSDDEIHEVNLEHRGMDKPTDVLSFPMVDMYNGEIQSSEGDIDMEDGRLLLGDILISAETCQRQAEEYGHSFERELAFLVTHGIFHLLGYDHMTDEDETRMIGKQEQVLQLLGLPR